MKCKFSDTKFSWALWLGIGLFVGAIATNGILNWLDVSSVQQSSGFNMIEGTGYFVSFLLIVLAIPVLEEFVFRIWGRGSKWTYIASIVLVPVLIMALTYNWVTGICMLVALLLAYLLTKGNLRMLLFMVITSIGFGFSHVLSFSELNASAIAGIIELTGLGFMLSFIAMNYGLIWAMIAHGLNNLVAFIMILLPMTFETEHYQVSIRPIGNTNSGYIENTIIGDTLILKGDAELFASILTHEQDLAEGLDNAERTTFYRMGKYYYKGLGQNVKTIDDVEDSKIKHMAASYYALPKYTMTITPKKGEFEPNYHEVLKGLEQKMLLRLDTTYEALYTLDIANNLFLNVPVDERKGTLGGLVIDLQLLYDLQLLPDEDVHLNTPLPINYSDIKGMTLDECTKYLKKEFGIELKKAKGKGVRIITYYGL